MAKRRKTTTPEDFGKDLRTIRNLLGLTQRELAEKAHLTRQHISNLETGKHRRLSAKTIMGITEALWDHREKIHQMAQQGEISRQVLNFLLPPIREQLQRKRKRSKADEDDSWRALSHVMGTKGPGRPPRAWEGHQDRLNVTAFKIIGLRLREYRILADMKQATLARKADLKVNEISRLEAGQFHGNWFDKLERIAKALGINVGSLIEEALHLIDKASKQVN